MLARVGLDPEIASELALGAKGPGALLIRHLRERFVLVAESDKALADLRRAFALVQDPTVRAAVAELARRCSVLEASDGATPPVALQALDDPELVTTWRGLADLLLLAEYRFDSLEGEGEYVDPEIASLRAALHTRVFDRLDELWDRSVQKGESRNEVWQRCFATLARHARRVYVIDRYAALHVVRQLSAPKRSRGDASAVWFLKHLARSAVEHVHVASSARELGVKADELGGVEDRIVSWFDGLGSGTRLHLHLVQGEFEHPRRLAFDGYVGFGLHDGLASFPDPISTSFSLGASAQAAQDIRRDFALLARRAD